MSRAVEACARELLETVPVVMRFIRNQVRRHHTAGLSLPQFRTLIFLNRTKDSSLSAVAEHLGLSLPAMSRLINGLVAGGLVERHTVSTNRRQIALTLTGRGRAKVEKVRKVIRLRLADVLKTLPTAEKESIRRTMRVLLRIFDCRAAAEAQLRGIKP